MFGRGHHQTTHRTGMTHRQPFCDPRIACRCALPEQAGHQDLALVAFPKFRQLLLIRRKTPFCQSLARKPLGLRLAVRLGCLAGPTPLHRGFLSMSNNRSPKVASPRYQPRRSAFIALSSIFPPSCAARASSHATYARLPRPSPASSKARRRRPVSSQSGPLSLAWLGRRKSSWATMAARLLTDSDTVAFRTSDEE